MNVLPSQPIEVASDFVLGDAEFRELAKLVHEQSGIVLTETKRGEPRRVCRRLISFSYAAMA